MLLSTPIHKSFRVEQVAGLFDLPLAEASTFELKIPAGLEALLVDRAENSQGDWQIGAIVGPSGSGKTSLAKHLLGQRAKLIGGKWKMRWPKAEAVIDSFGDQPIQQITQTLTSVGFSSPPAWLRPFHVLSTGEQFRCELARALLSEDETVVCDEFTSTVDRTVARSASAAVSRGIRRGRINKRFVAVSCHYDILDWLSPDWIADLATGELITCLDCNSRSNRRCKNGQEPPRSNRRCKNEQEETPRSNRRCKNERAKCTNEQEPPQARSCLRRPKIRLRVVGCDAELWRLFARHHYLSESLPGVNECYVALWPDEAAGEDVEDLPNGQPVAFCATCGLYGYKGRKRISRIVVQPDFQGLGIGPKLMETVAARQASLGFRVNITASHPAIRSYCHGSPNWKLVGVKKTGNRGHQREGARLIPNSHGRAIASFEFAARVVGG